MVYVTPLFHSFSNINPKYSCTSHNIPGPHMEDKQPLFQPLLPTAAATTATATATATSFLDDKDNDIDNIKLIILRLLSILFIGILSIWANYEASKGFEITILNDANHSPAGQRFALLYVSNDKATRLVLNASQFVENLLYPPHNNNVNFPKKQVNHVTLQLSSRNLTHKVIVENSLSKHEFVIHISPSVLMEESFNDVNYAMISAVQRGMARVWLWDSECSTLPTLVNGMIEYISNLAAGVNMVLDSGVGKAESGNYSSCWEDEDPVAVAHFLNYCEGQKKGFIQRLNQAMQYGCHERMVDDAIGFPAQLLCASYISAQKIAP